MKILEYIEKEHNSPRENTIIHQGMRFMQKSLEEYMKMEADWQKANHKNKNEDRNVGYLVGGNIRGKTVATNSSISLNGKNMAEIITINGNLKQ